jgi:hypothetical protein
VCKQTAKRVQKRCKKGAKKGKTKNSLSLSLRKLKTKLFTNIRESLNSFPPIMKNTQHLSSSQTSDNITPNNPECSFEKPFY